MGQRAYQRQCVHRRARLLHLVAQALQLQGQRPHGSRHFGVHRVAFKVGGAQRDAQTRRICGARQQCMPIRC